MSDGACFYHLPGGILSTDMKDISSCTIIMQVMKKRVRVKYWGGPMEGMTPLLRQDAKRDITEQMTSDANVMNGDLKYEDDRGSDFRGEWSLMI
jgi:hypothetical protein